MNATIVTLLQRVALALANIAARPTLAASLAEYGFDGERLQLGATLHANLSESNALQVQKLSDRVAATQAFRRARQEAESRFGRHRRLARVAVNGDSAFGHRLGLHQQRQRGFAGWATQAELFYGNALANGDLTAVLATVGIDSATLETSHAAIAELHRLHSVQNDANVAAQEATEARNVDRKALRTWYRQLRVIARLALGTDRQVLEAVSQQPVA